MAAYWSGASLQDCTEPSHVEPVTARAGHWTVRPCRCSGPTSWTTELPIPAAKSQEARTR